MNAVVCTLTILIGNYRHVWDVQGVEYARKAIMHRTKGELIYVDFCRDLRGRGYDGTCIMYAVENNCQYLGNVEHGYETP